MKTQSQLILALVGAVLILGFQNCSNSMSFSGEGELVAKAGTSETDIETVLIDQPINDGDGGTVVTPPPPSHGDHADDRHNDRHDDESDYDSGYDDRSDDRDRYTDRRDDPRRDVAHDDRSNGNYPVASPGASPGASPRPSPSPSSASLLRFVCVLEGPGHSVKVGFSSGSLSGQVGTPRDVCMTENACLNIISTQFNVKAVKQVGFCPDSNPHVIPMTDSQISAALAQAELAKELELSRQQQLGQRFAR